MENYKDCETNTKKYEPITEHKPLIDIYHEVVDADNWYEPWFKKVCELCLEYLMLDGLMDETRAMKIPDEVQEIVGKTLTHDDLDFFNER